ncbi:MAG: glutamate--cysteine ligase [Alphaproteobacteria bacterium]|nr:glutamate--cysteine ligase [Alphaproteobacteria bacterium]
MAGKPGERGNDISGKGDLVAWFEQGCKPPSAWRIGTEHEKFMFHRQNFAPLAYGSTNIDGTTHSDGADIRSLLEGLQKFGWQKILEKHLPIALSHGGGAAISLEPGGQFELSGAAVENLHETEAEIATHIAQLKSLTEPRDIGMLGLGFAPDWRRDDMNWMPKGRYVIMRRYMPIVGTLGLDMMLRTCTVQVNLDYQSEADMVDKYRVSLALQPLATALFANSPFTEGKVNGYQSYRSEIWRDTDTQRCGMIPFVFETGFGFEHYVDYLLDVPMYFVYRDGYIDVAGQSFRDFMAGKLPALPGERPSLGDFADHVSTVFPEVRMKRYLEMRGADVGPPDHLVALSAFWVGLLYDQTALDECLTLIKDWSISELEQARRNVPRQGLATMLHGRSLREWAMDVLKIADAGLKKRGRRGSDGHDERKFLRPIEAIAASGRSLATVLRDDYVQNGGGKSPGAFLMGKYAW